MGYFGARALVPQGGFQAGRVADNISSAQGGRDSFEGVRDALRAGDVLRIQRSANALNASLLAHDKLSQHGEVQRFFAHHVAQPFGNIQTINSMRQVFASACRRP